MTDAFPIALVGPSSKERKYDRQLRLWAASGQQALEQSRVLLVNSDGAIDGETTSVGGVAGTETLKNLVLPGVGGFTIVDPAIVTEADLGVNFFLEDSSLGKSRAQETCAYLKEMNPDVDGDYKSEVGVQHSFVLTVTDIFSFVYPHSQYSSFLSIPTFFLTINSLLFQVL